MSITHRCSACNSVLLESDGPLKQAIKIRCRKCKEWNEFAPNQERLSAAGVKDDN